MEAVVEGSPHYTIQFQSRNVPQKSIETIQIYFHPRELGCYTFQIPFHINFKQQMITIKGEAVPLLVDVYDPIDRCLDLTSTFVGQSKTKRVKVINNSKATISITFDLYDRLPYFSRAKKIVDPQFELEIKDELTM